MNSKTKGNIGEAMVLAEFIKWGIQVSIPFGDNARYDLIADFNGKLNKIQVKFCNIKSDENTIICHTASSTNHTTNKKSTSYENDVDYFAFYIPNINQCLLVPINVIQNKHYISLRLTKPKNNQQKNIKYVKDFLFEKLYV